MNILLIVEMSLLFQVAALVIAIWLIRIAGRKKAWVLLAMALAAMTVRRAYVLSTILSGGGTGGFDSTGELLALFASILVAAGMALTVPLILSMKRSEELQTDINRSLKMFTLSNEAIITATDELSLLQYICRVIFEVGRYRYAWIGYAERNGARNVRPVAQAGFREAGREAPATAGTDPLNGTSPVNIALRSCKPAFCNNALDDPAFETCRKEALEWGYLSMISLPLVADRQSIGVLNIYSDRADTFSLAEVKLLQEMTDDLVYGIKALRAREEHMRIEAALERSEERVRASIENMPDAFSIYSSVRNESGEISDFRIDYVNAAFCRICGAGQDDLAEKRLLEMLPEYRETGLFDEYCRVVETGEPLIKSWQIKVPDDDNGNRFDIRTYNIRAVKLEDGLVVAWRDITDLQRATEALRSSEARYLTIFNTASVPICVEDFSEVKKALNALKSCGVTDLRLYMDEHPEFVSNALEKIRIQDVNEAAIDLYEAESKDEILDSLEKIYLQESLPVFKDMLVAMMEEREFFEGETVNRTLKGKKLNVWIRITIPAYDSGFEKLLVSILDITERRKMEEELLRTQKLESLAVLAGGIAHDFNNMLTVILGNIVLGKMRLGRENDVYQRLEKAENAINRAMELTRNLLTFSKRGDLSKKAVEIGEMVREATHFALSGSKSKGEFFISPDLWPVEADSGQLRQVMESLVINADQAMPAGGTITVTCENLEGCPPEVQSLGSNRCVRISIADHGPGISGEIIEKIFDPYFSTKEGKSGLGLATAYSIIKKHGGEIRVESGKGNGAAFHVYLPVADSQFSAVEEGKGESLGRSRRVLVMDDEEEVREVAEGILRTLGCEIEQAKDGAEALELYIRASESGRPFDVVMLDLTISGGMGAKETIEKLLEFDRNVKAIVSTGYYNDPVISEYRKYGFMGALNKPYKPQELSEVLASVNAGDNG